MHSFLETSESNSTVMEAPYLGVEEEAALIEDAKSVIDNLPIMQLMLFHRKILIQTLPELDLVCDAARLPLVRHLYYLLSEAQLIFFVLFMTCIHLILSP